MIILKNKQNQPRVFIVEDASSETKARKKVTEYLGYEPIFFGGKGYGKHELPSGGGDLPQYAVGWWLRIL
ncbi:MAG: hypothetical protein D6675_09460 [Gemmatimonadetes bacterium]|nr:MAG: hypothetical protein D6675_09460 [Gemmatimonadota bacterium]